MFNFMPENLYKLIKDDPEYKKDLEMFESKYKPSTFEESFYITDNINTELKDEAAKFKEYIYNFAKTHCVDDSLSVKLTQTGHSMTKNELLTYWDDRDKLSNEEKLFLIGYIHNASYQDNSYLAWSKEYTDLYESLSEDDKKNLSAYCYENYILKGTEYYVSKMASDKIDNFLDTAITKIRSLLDDTLKYDESIDTLKHNYYEGIRFVVDCLAMNYPYDSSKQISAFGIDKFFDQKFQYKSISYAIMDIFDKIYDIFICDRDFINAFYVLKHMFKYIDFGMRDKVTFFRALEYYDKMNQYGMLCIMRKMIRISRYVPGIELSLKNLSTEDENFIMSQNFDMDKIESESIKYTFKNHLTKSDTMVTALIPIYEMLKNNGIDKRIKRILDGDKIEVFPTAGELIEANKNG